MVLELLHSPSVGPGTWEPVAACLRAAGRSVAVPDLRAVATATPPYWQTISKLATGGLRTYPAAEPVLLCGHSNAGMFLPTIAVHVGRPVAGLIFVDASVPPATGEAEMVQGEFVEGLRRRAVDGLVPRWTDWWSEEDVAALFPNESIRHRVTAEQVGLPLAYYEQRVRVPEGWQKRFPAAYLLFGGPYQRLAEEARARGWPVRTVPGEHLHMVVQPELVAETLVELSDLLVRQRESV